jgi:ankyrin repeat protein
MEELVCNFQMDVNKTWGFESLTFLHMACLLGEEDWVIFLLNQGANIAVKDSQDRTPLSIAYTKFVLNKKDKLMEILLNRSGGYLQDLPINGTVALNYAIKKHDHSLLRSILEQGVCWPPQFSWLQESPFFVAVKLKDLEAAALLIEFNYGPHNCPTLGTAVKVACERAHYKMVDLLLHHIVDRSNIPINECFSIIWELLKSKEPLRYEFQREMTEMDKLATLKVLLQHGLHDENNNTSQSFLMLMLQYELMDSVFDDQVAQFYLDAIQEAGDHIQALSVEDKASLLRKQRTKLVSHSMETSSSEVFLQGIKVRIFNEDGLMMDSYFLETLTVDVSRNSLVCIFCMF